MPGWHPRGIGAVRMDYVIVGAGGLQTLMQDLGYQNEYHIGFDGPQGRQLDACKMRSQTIGHVIGVSGKLKPTVVCQECLELRRDETMLRGEVAAALASLAHAGGTRRIEEHHRLGGKRPPFGGAEGQYVHASTPTHLGRRHAKPDYRVCEPRAVHVDCHAA